VSGEHLTQDFPSWIDALFLALTGFKIQVLATLRAQALTFFTAQNFGRQFQQKVRPDQLGEIKHTVFADNVFFRVGFNVIQFPHQDMFEGSVKFLANLLQTPVASQAQRRFHTENQPYHSSTVFDLPCDFDRLTERSLSIQALLRKIEGTFN
jgi:hypothetical protein